MATNEVVLPSFVKEGAQQIDKEILSSAIGLRKVGGTILTGEVLASGTILARVASGKYVAYASANETQTITVTATGGTFTISFDGETTTALAYNASAATVLAALEALSCFAAGDIAVALATGVYTLTFGGRYDGLDVAIITLGVGSLTGGTATAAAGTAGGHTTAGKATAVAVLHKSVDATSGDVLGELILGGTLKYDQLVGIDTKAISDLNGRIDTVLNTFTF